MRLKEAKAWRLNMGWHEEIARMKICSGEHWGCDQADENNCLDVNCSIFKAKRNFYEEFKYLDSKVENKKKIWNLILEEHNTSHLIN